MPLSRRQFLAASAAATVVASGGLRPPLASAIDPIKRPSDKPDLKLSLAAYSFNKALDLKKPTMTLFEFIDLAADLPLDAVELTSYYWAETTDAYAEKLKAHAAKRKLAISGVPVRNNFCQRDEAKRKKDIEHVKDVDRDRGQAGRDDGPHLRRQRWRRATRWRRRRSAWSRRSTSAARWPRNSACSSRWRTTAASPTRPEHLLDLVKPVKSKALGVNIDTGNFKTPDPYADIAKIAPYGVVSQVKTEVSPGGKTEEADLARVVKILKDANFHGYVALEYEAKEDPKTAVPKYVKELRKLISG